MQRSRTVFLPRKAFNLLLLFCWASFFFSIAHTGRGKTETLNNKTCRKEVEPGFIKGFLPGDDMCYHSATDWNWSPYSGRADTKDSCCEKQSKEEYENYSTTVNLQVEAENLSLVGGSTKDIPKSDRFIRDVPVGLDEFKNKAINPKGKPAIHQAGLRVEPGGKEYNFASASKGAKVLAVNKEAKGASNILGKDMDKYLRNPCSAERKFVIIELSEETLVDTIEIANFEHHSSKLKDFELFGSLVYPTESWVLHENFTAKNVKQAQRFTLKGPKWVRYLKLILLSHYGSEFYCTLSTLQVYGVDAVEHMLEDLISVQDNFFATEESSEEQRAIASQVTNSQIDCLHQNLIKESDSGFVPDGSAPKHNAPVNDMSDPAGELRQPPVSRMPGDSVLKILMQKVRSLDLSLSVLERYLEELNSRYGSIFTDLEKEIAEKGALLKDIRSDLMNLGYRNDIIGKNIEDIMSWKSLVSSQMEILERENAFLRMTAERMLDNQVHMENKEIIVLLISLFCSVLAATKLFVDMTRVVCGRNQEFNRFLRTNFALIFVLLSFGTISIVPLL